MEIAKMIRIGLVIIGIVIMILSFCLHSARKLTVNIAVVWELLGIAAILVGAVHAFSGWCDLIGKGTAAAMFIIGLLILLGGFQFSILISTLSMKNQEMAMQVSLLNQENERILAELQELTGKSKADL